MSRDHACISWYHRLRSQLMCTKTEMLLQSLQVILQVTPCIFFYKHWRELHSRGDPAVQSVLLLCTYLFFSHTSTIVRFAQWPHKLLHWTRDMLGSCLNSLDPTFLSFHCISEKQEAAAHKHHTSFRAWCEAHQKATGIFLLVLVGFSYRLHSFQGIPQ